MHPAPPTLASNCTPLGPLPDTHSAAHAHLAGQSVGPSAPLREPRRLEAGFVFFSAPLPGPTQRSHGFKCQLEAVNYQFRSSAVTLPTTLPGAYSPRVQIQLPLVSINLGVSERGSPPHQCIVYSSSYSKGMVSGCDRGRRPTKLKVFTIGPFTDKAC